MSVRYFWLLIGLVMSPGLLAKEVSGVEFDDHISLAPDVPTLVLNGTAVRRKQQYTIYVAGLYLTVPSGSSEQILRDLGPKRLELSIQSERVEPEGVVNAWNQGFALNNSRDELRLLLPRIEAFNQLWVEPWIQGDRVAFDYLPGQGTRVLMNDKLLGIVPGIEFNRALLKTFIGRHPVARNVKEGLLGL